MTTPNLNVDKHEFKNMNNEVIKKSKFPLVMTICSFVFFLMAYLYIILFFINPSYIWGLAFGIPFVIFGIVTLLYIKDKIKSKVAIYLTEVLIPIFAIALFILYMALALLEVASTTTDISKYQRVLRITHFGHSELTNYFPSEIPDNSKDIYFSYRPQFLQGGENLTLNFETDSETITNYIKDYSQKATWSGNMSQADKEDNAIKQYFQGTEYGNKLPDDFTVYLLYSAPHNGSYYHGTICAVAISQQRNKIIFLMDIF